MNKCSVRNEDDSPCNREVIVKLEFLTMSQFPELTMYFCKFHYPLISLCINDAIHEGVINNEQKSTENNL
jgi:hypothetical protein